MNEYAACTMDKEHAKVCVSAPGDGAESSNGSAGVFPGSQTDESGEVTS